MYHLDPVLYCEKEGTVDSVQHFFNGTLLHMDLRSDKETIMDIGCGPGRITAKMILPLFPNLKKIYAVDLLPNMIEYAQSHNSHPKIEYSLASIEDWSTVERWEGQMSKVFAIHCFNWLKNQKQSFENVYRLLRSGGQAAFIFCLHAPYFQAVVDIEKDPKWKGYFENVDNCIPESHIKKYGAEHYKGMVKEIGFDIVYIKASLIPDSFPTDELFRNFYASICVLVSHVPIERREEFKDDLFQYNIRLNGRNSEGLATHKPIMLELVVKKRELKSFNLFFFYCR